MTLELFDTHCHIQSIGTGSEDFTAQKWRKSGVDNADEVIAAAGQSGVTRLICVGTDLEDSQRAIEFVQNRENCWASVGIHPHEAKDHVNSPEKLQKIRNLIERNKVVAVGECGLDYHYEHSPKAEQRQLLEFQLDLALEHNLPVIFHIRDAHEDFWPVFDNFHSAGRRITGVVHSFSATNKELDKALSRGLYVGLNGIMTFTSDKRQPAAAKNVPLDRLLLETDAPYLAPLPHRGKVCRPEHMAATAQFLATLRSETAELLASQTTKNACKLFSVR